MGESRSGKIPVVAIGQVPPPVTGQALMIRMLVDAAYPSIKITHVPMVLSDSVSSQGSFAFGKLLRLVQVPFKAVFERFRTGARVLYYPPSGAVKLAVLRDVFVLLLTRPFFARTVLHFHAGGMSEVYAKLPGAVQWLYRRALFYPDMIVRISPSSPSEMAHLQGRREAIVANGIDDPAARFVRQERQGGPVEILFVGHLIEGKGVLVLLRAVAALLGRGLAVHLTCIGQWGGEAVREQAEGLIREHGMSDHVALPGGLHGEPKWACFRAAHIFCLPSFFHSEIFPLVLLEAMAFSLPVVSTRWRGIPDVVAEGENALLVPVKDVLACAEALASLCEDAELRWRFGEASRRRYLAHFTSEVHLAAMEGAILSVAM